MQAHLGAFAEQVLGGHPDDLLAAVHRLVVAALVHRHDVDGEANPVVDRLARHHLRLDRCSEQS